jgi:hypothetical protein
MMAVREAEDIWEEQTSSIPLSYAAVTKPHRKY